MSERPKNLFDKWVNFRFDARMVVSVTQKNEFKNIGLSVINGRSYNTKLGNAMSAQLGPNELQDLITTLQEVQSQFFPEKPPE